MKFRNLLTCTCIAVFLCFSAVTNVSAKSTKDYVVYAPIEEVYLSFDDALDSGLTGEIVPLTTISSADLKITRGIAYHYSGYPGDLTYLEVDVTWEWLTFINNYNEDSITISWDNTYVDWRFYSTTVVRKHYTKNINQTVWNLRSTDYSVRGAAINGFIYDEDLIGNSFYDPYPTKNKGTIKFNVYPLSPTQTIGNFYLMVEYDHKVWNFGGGYGDSITFNGVSLSGIPSLTYNYSISYKYDSQSLAIGSVYHNHVPY